MNLSFSCVNFASPEELISILQISEPLTQKIIALRDDLGGFKYPKALIQLPELTNLEWEEWTKTGVIAMVECKED